MVSPKDDAKTQTFASAFELPACAFLELPAPYTIAPFGVMLKQDASGKLPIPPTAAHGMLLKMGDANLCLVQRPRPLFDKEEIESPCATFRRTTMVDVPLKTYHD